VSLAWARIRADPLRWLLFAIALGTFLSGLALMAVPGVVLDLLSAPTRTSDKLFFAIIGMFMAVVGGALTHALLRPPPSELVVGWSALQKLGASIAMSLAVALDVFSKAGLALVVFDFLSAVLAAAYWWRIRT
jgi:hypothetical protein